MEILYQILTPVNQDSFRNISTPEPSGGRLNPRISINSNLSVADCNRVHGDIQNILAQKRGNNHCLHTATNQNGAKV